MNPAGDLANMDLFEGSSSNNEQGLRTLSEISKALPYSPIYFTKNKAMNYEEDEEICVEITMNTIIVTASIIHVESGFLSKK